MFKKMSETQRSMLHAATTREDRLVTSPANARAAAMKALAGKWIDAGWVKEIKACYGAPVWRKDAASGETYGLKLTVKGLKAASAMIEAADRETAPSVPGAAIEIGLQAPSRGSALSLEASASAHDGLHNENSLMATRTPRPNSKLGRVLSMLVVDAGATIGELTAATGWLEHTTRAALTGLRHRGYELTLTRKERDGASVYRIVARGEEAAQ
jgi:Protein of unknown function (DUF3489)